jgi:hypothetical protein
MIFDFYLFEILMIVYNISTFKYLANQIQMFQTYLFIKLLIKLIDCVQANASLSGKV